MSIVRLMRIVLTVVVAGALLVGGLVSLLNGPQALVPALRAFAQGVAGSPTSLGATVSTLTPILLIGVAATLAFRAGLFDVGQIGQFVSGATAAGIVAPLVPGPGMVVILVTLAAAVVAGALWSMLAAFLADATGLDLIVLSLVANYLADGLARLLVRTTFQDPESYSVIATRPVPEDAWLPVLLPQTSLHFGLLLAIAVFLVAAVVMAKGVWGHKLRLFGLNPAAAELSGVEPRAFRLQVLAISGGVCGFAGAVQVLGVFHRYQDGAFGGSASIAWTGLTAAILVPAGIVAVLPMACLLAILSAGFIGIQRDLGVSAGLGTLLQGVVIIAAALAMTSTDRTGTGSKRTSRKRATLTTTAASDRGVES